MRTIHICAVLFSMALLMACGSDSAFMRSSKSGYIGKSGKLLVVVDQFRWEGTLGDSLKEIFHRPVPFLTNREEMFGIIQIDPKDFEKDYQKYRNILFLEVEDRIDLQEPKLKAQPDKYAKGQMFITAGAKTETALENLLMSAAQQMVDEFNNAELERTQEYFDIYGAPASSAAIQEEFGAKVLVPVQSTLRKRSNNFVHALRNMGRKADGQFHDVRQGIVVYSFPYESDSTFTLDYLMDMRDSIFKSEFEGDKEGSYVRTERRYLPTTREIELNGAYAFEMKGLWRYEGDFGGGPFVSVALLDASGQNVLVSEGYVYAPRFRMDEYLREVEACAKSIDINPKTPA